MSSLEASALTLAGRILRDRIAEFEAEPISISAVEQFLNGLRDLAATLDPPEPARHSWRVDPPVAMLDEARASRRYRDTDGIALSRDRADVADHNNPEGRAS